MSVDERKYLVQSFSPALDVEIASCLQHPPSHTSPPATGSPFGPAAPRAPPAPAPRVRLPRSASFRTAAIAAIPRTADSLLWMVGHLPEPEPPCQIVPLHTIT
mmetsp:Transcript_27145/g.71536  ORF Transcript_27145/g.71536 Transcript_27145/m.71536 type:complete len:103 (+) Transcript_27145:125-433(+)